MLVCALEGAAYLMDQDKKKMLFFYVTDRLNGAIMLMSCWLKVTIYFPGSTKWNIHLSQNCATFCSHILSSTK